MSDRHDPAVVLDLLAATPGVPEDQLLGFGSYLPPDETHRRGRWGDFGWAQPGAFADAVRRRRDRPDGYGCRLITFPEDVVTSLREEWHSGGIDEAAYVLGFMVDIDADERRSSDDDYYIPTIERAWRHAAEILRPTLALDSGGGVPVAYLLDEAVRVADVGARWLARLNARFTDVFGRSVHAAGWAFDTPPGFAWLRLPGSLRWKYPQFDQQLYERLTWVLERKHARGERLDEESAERWRCYRPFEVAVLDASGPRYSLAEIEEIAGPDDGKPFRSWSYGDWDADMTTWNGDAIPGPHVPDDWSGGTPSQRRGAGGRSRPRPDGFTPLPPDPWRTP